MSGVSGGKIFLWETGRFSGTAATRDRAFEVAGDHLDGDAEALVEEAGLAMTEAGSGGLVSGHERTGAAWRGRLHGGEPVWEPDATGARYG